MARGRFISESVATDARLNSLSVEAELAYLMAVPHLDRDGLIEGDPDVLWGKVCVKRRAFLDMMPSLIEAWAKAGLVTMYDTDEEPVLWFHGFAKNQVGLRYDREAPSKFPPPPGYMRDDSGMIPVPAPIPDPPPPDEVPDAQQSSADELRQNSGEGVAQLEVEVKDQVKDQSSPAGAPDPPPPDDDGGDEDLEVKQTKALTAKLHSVGIALTPYVVDCYSDFAKDYGIEAVLRGIASAADNGKQHRMNYVQRCIVTASQGDTHGANHRGNSADYQRPAVAQFTTAERKAYDAQRRAELPY